MKKVFGQMCYMVGGTMITTFLLGMTFGLTCRPDRNVVFSSTINTEEKSSSNKKTEQ